MNIDLISTETAHLMEKISGLQSGAMFRKLTNRDTAEVFFHLGDALQRLEAASLELESDPVDDGVLGEIKRTLHSLKGDAGCLGLPEISDVFHETESLLEVYEQASICPSEMLLKVKDWMQTLLTASDGNGSAQRSDAANSGENAAPCAADGIRPAEIRTLVVEDDFATRFLMQELLKPHGPVHIAVNGREAVEAVGMALSAGEPYDLVLLDIMMPEMDGQEALRKVRALEEGRGIFSSKGAKIVMTTALDGLSQVSAAFSGLCDGYIVKPIEKAALFEELRKLGLPV